MKWNRRRKINVPKRILMIEPGRRKKITWRT
jgi:hypothetical protein